MSYFEDFEFDLPSALLERLVLLFSKMTPGALNDETVQGVPEAQGVYQLFFNNELVYIGKTDAGAGLKKRLLRHARKVQSRRNLPPGTVTFKAIRVYVFTAMDLEDMLLKHYRADGPHPAWNNSGFGSNDPGQKRDQSDLKDHHFDKLHPIDLDVAITHHFESFPITAADFLKFLKTELTYTIRYQSTGGRSRRAHADLVACQIVLTEATKTVREWLRQIKGALGANWQITALPGYVLVYKENKPYLHGEIIEG
ncbi:GIY-YIG nuclease family protein [Pusillimonas noertemannii]|uniref:GIY-YIG catalytic domain-containing protein n=1 Tax=Pusillimonas noertemannii TaxID=305977 RepID=A0A2U1CM96_9BURK|nr:GIY-YIG nuclease family protein [Pusillimonas noertemannii]NYT68838.1 GIY-YIG nuclease family protein [Pusillimonas noertemannii]PVY62140.1 hypothetical protein C7440_1632 [Pusillimonas noertemannii]TFL10870.1 GIY-YIG nuclease family protein [Pusillimonas noertemannii]